MDPMKQSDVKKLLIAHNLGTHGNLVQQRRRLCMSGHVDVNDVCGPKQYGGGIDTIGFDHEKIYGGIEIRESPGKGLGVFARQKVPKGTILGLMNGVHMSEEVYEKQVNKDKLEEYRVMYDWSIPQFTSMEVYIAPRMDTRGNVLDADGEQMMFMINEPSVGERANVAFLKAITYVEDPAQNYSFVVPVQVGVACVTCKAISEDSELLVHYGDLHGERQRGPACERESISTKDNKHFVEAVIDGTNERDPYIVAAVGLRSNTFPAAVHVETGDGSVTSFRGDDHHHGIAVHKDPVALTLPSVSGKRSFQQALQQELLNDDENFSE